MKTAITKKIFTFILLISGIFSFSIAEAQSICDCTNNQPGYCYVDNQGTIKCQRYHPHAHIGFFRVKSNGTATASHETSLSNIFPNPVSSSTTISFYLFESQRVSLKVFDTTGRLVSTVADKVFEDGENEFLWSPENINGGIYFLQIQSEENQERIKLVVTN